VYGLALSIWFWEYGFGRIVWRYDFGRMILGAQSCKQGQAKLKSIYPY